MPNQTVTKPSDELNPIPEGLGLGESHCSELRISGPTARIIILNCHSLLRRRFYNVPLWSMVGHITGHGSGNSMLICQSANLDPHQAVSSQKLRDYIPNGADEMQLPEEKQ